MFPSPIKGLELRPPCLFSETAGNHPSSRCKKLSAPKHPPKIRPLNQVQLSVTHDVQQRPTLTPKFLVRRDSVSMNASSGSHFKNLVNRSYERGKKFHLGLANRSYWGMNLETFSARSARTDPPRHSSESSLSRRGWLLASRFQRSVSIERYGLHGDRYSLRCTEPSA